MKRLSKTIDRIKPVDKEIMEEAQKRLDQLTKPHGSLGRLEELAKRVVGITGKPNPALNHKLIITMAGDHGVVEEGISAFPQEVTSQMVYNFLRGGAGINVLAKHVGAKVQVVDMGVATDLERSPELIIKKIGYGTRNFTEGLAMSPEEALQSIEAGIEIVEELSQNGLDILGVGDMGIGNTTPSSAIIAVFSGCRVRDVTGRGTGIENKVFDNKVKVIEKGLVVNKPNPEDPIDVLAKVGGFEIGGIAGSILAGAAMKIPVVIDGFISTAGALMATELAPLTKEYIIASHNSQEVGHKVMLERMGLRPLLDLDLRLGEGTGAALGISLVEAAIKILTEMATFADAGVSERTNEIPYQ